MLEKEEKLNTLSHALGIILGLIGFVVLYLINDGHNSYGIFSISVYSFTFVLLFTASTLYHRVRDPKLKNKLRILDHISIYFLILLYLIMGWLIVLDLDNLLGQTTTIGLGTLFLGGAFYTIGILFYAIERIPYNHFIWHLFVLGGAISHWCFILIDVL